MEINKAKEKAEDLIVQLRELLGTLRKSAPLEDQNAQKEQIRVIDDSIQHLENKNVPVPADLLKLKKKLEAEIHAAEKYQVLIFFLKDQLTQVIKEIGTQGQKNVVSETAHKKAS